MFFKSILCMFVKHPATQDKKYGTVYLNKRKRKNCIILYLVLCEKETVDVFKEKTRFSSTKAKLIPYFIRDPTFKKLIVPSHKYFCKIDYIETINIFLL